MNSWFDNLNKLKDMHSRISLDLQDKKIAYIDIPCHYNTGDLLIYLGTEKFFLDYNIDISYRALQNDINYKLLLDCDVILIHGGGNFGDLYIEHQNLRNDIINKCCNKQIIFLPQSVYFNSDTELLKTETILKKVNNLIFYVRDNESEIIAKRFTDNVILMPDMAHSLHPLVEGSEVNSDNGRILNLQRVDIESSDVFNGLSKKAFDWIDLCSASDVFFQKIINKSRRLPFFRDARLDYWNLQSRYNVNMAINYVSAFDIVYTDRLHGFILSYLLGKRVFLLDNSYSKIDRYHKAWFSDCPLISKVM